MLVIGATICPHDSISVQQWSIDQRRTWVSSAGNGVPMTESTSLMLHELRTALSGAYDIEAPLGRVRYETPHQLHELRIASDGRIAWLELYGGQEDVVVLGTGSGAKPSAVARGWRHGVNGMAWSTDGKEIWITGTDTPAPPALYAVNADTGDVRLAAGLSRVVLYVRGPKIFRVYSLPDLAKQFDASVDMFFSAPSIAASASASTSP